MRISSRPFHARFLDAFVSLQSFSYLADVAKQIKGVTDRKTDSYAWFTMSREVEVTNIQMVATVPEDLQISLGEISGGSSSTNLAANNGFLVSSSNIVGAPTDSDDDDPYDWSNSVSISTYYDFGKLIPAGSTNGEDVFFTPDSAGVGKTMKAVANSYMAADAGVAQSEAGTGAGTGKYNATAHIKTAAGETTWKAGGTGNYTTASAWNNTKDDGYYIDIPFWLRTSSTTAPSIYVTGYIKDGTNASSTADTDGDELYKAVRVAILDENGAAAGGIIDLNDQTSAATAAFPSYKSDVTSLVDSVMLVIGLPVFAWFANQRKTATVIQINAPTTINIKSGNEEPVEMIDLSNINVKEYLNPEDETSLISYGEYVFCITGKYLSEYDIQIARTTNIDFDYELYRVDNVNYSAVSGITTDPGKINNYGVAEYKSELDDNTYYYPYKKASFESSSDVENYKKQGNITQLGHFLNPAANGSQTVGSGSAVDGDGKTFHKRNYGDIVANNEGGTSVSEYNKVNVYAEPLYWQVKNLPVMGQIGDSGFVDYYVLRINWDGKNLENNKETDMIYITARKSVS